MCNKLIEFFYYNITSKITEVQTVPNATLSRSDICCIEILIVIIILALINNNAVDFSIIESMITVF